MFPGNRIHEDSKFEKVSDTVPLKANHNTRNYDFSCKVRPGIKCSSQMARDCGIINLKKEEKEAKGNERF